MFPQIKLALIFARMARDHGQKLLHSNNPGLLTKDLGDALKKQKDILSDPRKGMVMTAYDVLPIIIEVKIMTITVAKKLGIETKGKADINILEEIIAQSDAKDGGKYSKDIKDTLEWTRKLFANPEIQDVLKMEMTAIETPTGIGDVTKFIKQLASRSQDELTRVAEFLKRAKIAPEEPKAEPKAEDKTAVKKPRKPRKPKNDGPAA